MSIYLSWVEYYSCAYCEEIINTMLSADKTMSQYKITKLVKSKMNSKTAIKHIEDLIDVGIIIDYGGPALRLLEDIKSVFLETSYEPYGKPARKGILDFSNENDVELLSEIIKAQHKKRKKSYALWFDYAFLYEKCMKKD
ncbi:MAG: hypothetical protein AMDU1_APLC00022G0002 [Thermoplasmatales archaeon A-plasma]|nr:MULTISPECIES: hypothetical protein [Thermoplasmatales]EQB71565.1 MAG: hypothetical protein AMDU1_APLC00022G0002 [Thermoplasmatales archaeon A-plasma]MCI2412824.1 hypothetical protein [Cuniculiplasma sp.]WMT53367.1 MAG: hypothetical protein RE473_00620 [Ferroplasma acidiphilum]